MPAEERHGGRLTREPARWSLEQGPFGVPRPVNRRYRLRHGDCLLLQRHHFAAFGHQYPSLPPETGLEAEEKEAEVEKARSGG